METERTEHASAHRRRPVGKPPKKQKQEISYTQPRPFYRNRLIVQLISIAAVVLAVTLGISVFFKVDTVTVAGISKYSAATIVDASSVRTGDSLLFFGRAGAAYKIKSKLPYVDTVRFRLELPGTVHIIIEEKMIAYAVQALDGSWWMMTADGMLAEKTTAAEAEKGPVIEGVIIHEPVAGKMAVAAQLGAEDGTATAADRLEVAVKILTQMEKWELVVPNTHIDVSDLFALRLYCGSDYRVELGDRTDLETKIGIVKGTLLQLEGESGVIKLTYNETEGTWMAILQTWHQQ